MRQKKAKEWTYYYIECMDLLGRGEDNVLADVYPRSIEIKSMNYIN